MHASSKTTGREIVPLALLGDISLMRCRAFDRGLTQFVRRPEAVEDGSCVGQQMLAPFLPQPHGIWEDRERIALREISDRVERPSLQQFVDLRPGSCGETIPDLLHDGRRQYL